jgi:NAD(P)H-flavin reductase
VSVVTAPLVEIVRVTPRTRLLVIDVRSLDFAFQAGQAILLGVHGSSEQRPYSIASSPDRAGETGTLEILISVDESGQAGSHLPDLTRGVLVDIQGPIGTFVLADDDVPERVLLVAGGTGIAPLRAMADHLLRRFPDCHLSMLYSARSHQEFAFIEELRQHANAQRLELHQTVTRDDGATWIGGRGRIGQAHFEAVLHAPAETLCFVCGPAALVSESVATLKALGVPARHIRTEAWMKRSAEPALRSDD